MFYLGGSGNGSGSLLCTAARPCLSCPAYPALPCVPLSAVYSSNSYLSHPPGPALQASENGASTLDVPIKDLTNGVTYTFSVEAKNKIGWSQPSDKVTESPRAGFLPPAAAPAPRPELSSPRTEMTSPTASSEAALSLAPSQHPAALVTAHGGAWLCRAACDWLSAALVFLCPARRESHTARGRAAHPHFNLCVFVDLNQHKHEGACLCVWSERAPTIPDGPFVFVV